MTDSVLRGQALNRSERLCDGGAMMTTVGSGQSYTHFIANREVKTARSKRENEMVDKLRSDTREYMPCNLLVFCLPHWHRNATHIYFPVWQAFEDAFLEGLMPTMAKDIRVQLLTRLLHYITLLMSSTEHCSKGNRQLAQPLRHAEHVQLCDIWLFRWSAC